MFVEVFNLPAIEVEASHVLEHHPALLGSVQNPPAIHIQPHSHMDRVTGLPKQGHIALPRAKGWPPVQPHRMVADGLNQQAEIFGVNLNGLQIPAIKPPLNFHH